MAHRAHRTASTAALAAASLVLAAGCDSSSSGSPSAASSGSSGSSATVPVASAERPLLTTAEANTVVDTYQDLNNRANARRSPTLTAKGESGAMLAADRAYFRQIPGLDPKEVKGNLAPFAYVHRTFYIPPASAKADWFTVKTRVAELKGGKPQAPSSACTRFLVFRHTGGGWRAVAAAGFSGAEQKKIPAVALDRHGLAQVADPAARIGSTAPSALAGLVDDLYVTGGAKTPLAKTKDRDGAISVHDNRADRLGGHAYSDYKQAAPRDGGVYALRTTGGGALVLTDSAVDQTVLAKDLNSWVSLGKALQPFVKNGSQHMYKVVEHDMQTLIAVLSPTAPPAV